MAGYRCQKCYGSGRCEEPFTCPVCQGTGYVKEDPFSFRTTPVYDYFEKTPANRCRTCNGFGGAMMPYICEVCNGTGWVDD